MDFFQHQERARRKTGLLVLYFVVAVVAVIASVTAAMLLILSSGSLGPPPYGLDRTRHLCGHCRRLSGENLAATQGRPRPRRNDGRKANQRHHHR